jgi:hypothetical protein
VRLEQQIASGERAGEIAELIGPSRIVGDHPAALRVVHV